MLHWLFFTFRVVLVVNPKKNTFLHGGWWPTPLVVCWTGKKTKTKKSGSEPVRISVRISVSSQNLGFFLTKKMPSKWRTIKSLVKKTQLYGRRGKGTAESFSREKLMEKSCVTFLLLLCNPGWYVRKHDVQNKQQPIMPVEDRLLDRE